RPSAVPVCDPKSTVTGTAGPPASAAGAPVTSLARKSPSQARCSGVKGASSGILIGKDIALWEPVAAGAAEVAGSGPPIQARIVPKPALFLISHHPNAVAGNPVSSGVFEVFGRIQLEIHREMRGGRGL